MTKLQKQVSQFYLVGFVLIILGCYVEAEETIIQEEKISFQKCLEVITTSQDKLSIDPQIEDISDQERVAVFTLVDGTLTIRCEGIEGKVTVSTNMN